MSFFSRLNRPTAKVSPIGDGTTPTYGEFVEDGRTVLKVTGKDNLFEYVQASKSECDIYTILARYQRGDVDVLNSRVGQYLDVVGMPTNMAEAYRLMNDVKYKFDTLSPDIRKKFDNSVDVFVDKVSHATPDQLRELFGVTAEQVDKVKDGDVDVA